MRHPGRGQPPVGVRLCLLVLAAAGYTLAAWSVAPGFYDGIAPPQPYRWMSPPPQLARDNQPPLPGSGSVAVAGNGLVNPGTVFTQDGQASISFVPGAFQTPPDRSRVTIEIKPVATFPDPGQVQVATNVYCFTSSSPLAAGKDVLITLHYSDQLPAPGDVYGYESQRAWRKLGNTGAAAPYQVAVRTSFLGCFAGGYPKDAGRPAGPRVAGGQTLPIVVALLILIVVLAGIPLAVLRRRGHDDGPERG